MQPENTPTNPETPSPRLDEPVVSTPIEEPEAVRPAPAAQSRFGRFLRDLLRIVAVGAVLLGLGFLAGYLLLAVPRNQQVRTLTNDLNSANAGLTDAKASLESAKLQTGRLEDEKETLQADLTSTRAHVLLLQAFADVAEARMELALQNPTGAKAALAETAGALQELEASVPAEQAGAVEALYTRLNLVDAELDTDAELAATDLETLSDQLLALEAALFPEAE